MNLGELENEIAFEGIRASRPNTKTKLKSSELYLRYIYLQEAKNRYDKHRANQEKAQTDEEAQSRRVFSITHHSMSRQREDEPVPIPVPFAQLPQRIRDIAPPAVPFSETKKALASVPEAKRAEVLKRAIAQTIADAEYTKGGVPFGPRSTGPATQPPKRTSLQLPTQRRKHPPKRITKKSALRMNKNRLETNAARQAAQAAAERDTAKYGLWGKRPDTK